MPILCEDICTCGVHFEKDPECSGDYHETVNGNVLMRYCPVCGVMKPLLEERDPEYISNNMKKRIAVRIATTYKLGYKNVKVIINTNLRDVSDRQKFVNRLSRKVGLSPDQVLSCCL